MKLIAVSGLSLVPETGSWYRAIRPAFLPAALGTIHTSGIFSRFSPGSLGRPPFQILYLAETHQVALFEVAALLGSPTIPGATVANPFGSWVVINAQVQLSAVADLTQNVATSALGTSAQELTGDWQGYQQRGSGTSVSLPVGAAPTQELGEALKQDTRSIEGFRTLSAKLPYHRILGVFPENLRAGSYVSFAYRDSSGADQEHVIRASGP